MISSSQMESQVKAGESETLEFKRSTGERRSATQTLCGMLNHRGGQVFFGVEPDGRIVGQMVSDHTIEELALEIKEIDPPVFPTIERVEVNPGRHVLIITVPQGCNRPYCYKGHSYHRVGNTTPKMSGTEYHRMLIERLHGETRWENEAAVGWTVADLETTEIIHTLEESIRRGRQEDPGLRDPAEVLRGFGLMRNGILLRAAVMLFARAERLETDMPQCMLRMARFRGTDKTEFLDNRQFHGNAFAVLRQAERFLRDSLPIAGRVQPGLFERTDDPLYPPEALREALANAVCHRDYSIGGGSVSVAIYDDRLEIASSGTLHFGLTASALFQPHESLPWNPMIARVFYRRGLIESWGRGTIKMSELAIRAGLPQPEIEETSGCVLVRFRPMRYVPPSRVAQNLTERQQQVLTVIASKRHGIALREIWRDVATATERQIRDDLAVLKMLGLAKSEGHGRGARWILL